MSFSIDPGMSPSILLYGGDPIPLLRRAEALADLYPGALLSMPGDLAEALRLVPLRRYHLTILDGLVAESGELLRKLAETERFHRVLCLGHSGFGHDLPLKFRDLPVDARPRDVALSAASLLGLASPYWNVTWSEALRVIGSEFLTLRVSVRGPGGLTGGYYFVRGRMVSSRVWDGKGRSYSAEDLLYLPGLQFQSSRAESVLRSPAVHGHASLRAPGRTSEAESTIFRAASAAASPPRAGLSAPLQIALVEGDARICHAVERVLETEPDLHLLDTYGCAEEALHGLMLRPPRVVLVDLKLPGLSGLQLIARLAGHLPETEFLALTPLQDDQHVMEFLRQGGAGCLVQPELADHLAATLRAVDAGQAAPMSPGGARKLLRFFALPHPHANPVLARLGPGEEDLLVALARGHRLGEIASQLGRPEAALARQLRLILHRYAATSRAQSKADALASARPAPVLPAISR